jgi:hypothetical protein
VSIEQEGWRTRNDDGSETTATWKGAQDTKINVSSQSNFRLRGILNFTGDEASKQYKIQYKESGDPDAEWRDVPVA